VGTSRRDAHGSIRSPTAAEASRFFFPAAFETRSVNATVYPARMVEMVRCPNCGAPLRLDAGPIAHCAYCGTQSRVDTPGVVVAAGTPGQTRLVDAVSFVTPTITVPFLDKGKTLPIFRTETLSTRTDDQDALDVNIVQGSDPIVHFRFPIQKRGPRGVPKLALTVRVAVDGAMSITVAEPGTTNVVDRDQLRVRVV
jgi:hypothetical protein